MLATLTMKPAKTFARLSISFALVTGLLGSGCAMLGPAAVHAAPRAVLGKSAVATVAFVPFHILIPTVQTTISTTVHLLENGIARSENKHKKTTERKQYEKQNQ